VTRYRATDNARPRTYALARLQSFLTCLSSSWLPLLLASLTVTADLFNLYHSLPFYHSNSCGWDNCPRAWHRHRGDVTPLCLRTPLVQQQTVGRRGMDVGVVTPTNVDTSRVIALTPARRLRTACLRGVTSTSRALGHYLRRSTLPRSIFLHTLLITAAATFNGYAAVLLLLHARLATLVATPVRNVTRQHDYFSHTYACWLPPTRHHAFSSGVDCAFAAWTYQLANIFFSPCRLSSPLMTRSVFWTATRTLMQHDSVNTITLVPPAFYAAVTYSSCVGRTTGRTTRLAPASRLRGSFMRDGGL